MNVRIKQNAFIAKVAAFVLKEKTMAVTINKTIYLHNCSKENFLKNKRWLRHEAAHILQYKQLGTFRFIVLYFAESLINGYSKNKFELEALQMENDLTIADKMNFI
ncbi:MAG: DUF4157 domain-containing protein [Parafilimonas sp.]|nr:DUF4157 domain-containing protein [Parafilimonas sp.]